MTLIDRNIKDRNPNDRNSRPLSPAEDPIDQALARLNQVQPPSHFQQRLTARITRELASPVSVPFYERLRWRTVSLVAAGLAAAFIGGVFARPLLHHATPPQPVAAKPAMVQPVAPAAAQPGFNVRLADGHTAAMSPAGVVASARARNEHMRSLAHGQQDPTLGKLANKPPRPGQANAAPATAPAQSDQVQSDQSGSSQAAPATTAPSNK
jgi:hypothetical protein